MRLELVNTILLSFNSLVIVTLSWHCHNKAKAK
jgi:hypothetical protein